MIRDVQDLARMGTKVRYLGWMGKEIRETMIRCGIRNCIENTEVERDKDEKGPSIR